MVIGADTGFFVELAKENPTVKNIWNNVCNSDEKLVVSVITLNEISIYFYMKYNVK